MFGIRIADDGAHEIARRARGTPRIAGRLLRRVRDFALVAGDGAIDRAIAAVALKALEVDEAGLDVLDRRYLSTVALNYGGGPVGVDTIAAAISEPRDALEEIVEPLSPAAGPASAHPARPPAHHPRAFQHLGLAVPAQPTTQFQLFSDGDDV